VLFPVEKFVLHHQALITKFSSRTFRAASCRVHENIFSTARFASAHLRGIFLPGYDAQEYFRADFSQELNSFAMTVRETNC